MPRTNRRRLEIPAAVAVTLAFAVSAASATDINGFLREKGQGDIALSYTGETYDKFWRGSTKVPTPDFLGKVSTDTASAWMAYGITDDLTLIATLPRVSAEGDGTMGFSESDVQDLSVLAAYRLAAVGSSVRSEFIGALGGSTPASSYEGDLPVSVGDHTTDVQLRFVYLLRKGGFYWSQQIGYDLRRGGDAPNGFPFYTEVGYTKGRTTFNGFFSKLVAEDGTDIGDPGFTFPSNKEEYERGGAKVYVRITGRFGVAVSGFGTFSGRNTGDSSGASLGLNYRFAKGKRP